MEQILLTLTLNVVVLFTPTSSDTTKVKSKVKVIDKPGVYWPAERDTTINWNKKQSISNPQKPSIYVYNESITDKGLQIQTTLNKN